MSVQIKSLSNTAPTLDNSLAAPLDTFNTIPTANVVYNLYTAPSDANNKKAAIVKSLRVTNIKSQTVAISLYFNRPNSNGLNRRRPLGPQVIALGAGLSYIDDAEITLEPGDSIQAQADNGHAIQYVISGVEREVT